ncbi:MULTISPECIES: polysaccharide pyruvyl transferase family protein [Parabacteroides]|jgi:pyruvyl transferase EpsO|uniref:polysaccharide pyruvyl transferase family protein n=1 Tax=Parabacteroides TaxID=375288 RepID=UPI0001BBAF72|nr:MULTISPECIES: polysaccharide pyruvyl transferase family protein [Parabacteroides]EEY84481.1 polysaccharide pyruvyl transferase [Bacteroides sp. 2_1_33B]MDB9026975.1 polysaccharide pyruvyl transferase family protein [Parabacteroides distasonis]MDB9043718.1 polysaccharide pyruvyl transferase family protein [Parabacteroides distasonis]MDB9094416.1 polysaccharide pyruvyl transferase family protein [Parabacteroides distasonis]MDB9161803.1 polysaccharide pyruvyl transferase family protein [Paraba
MNFAQKVDALRSVIRYQLIPLISDSYVFLDLPYYTNIGDALIWEGTETFLSSLPAKCLYRCSCQTFSYRPLPKDTTILLQGGGNFGDIWRRHQDFRLKVIKLYPNNKIVILPQTIYYKNDKQMLSDAALMMKHPDLHICARDQRSYRLLEAYFVNCGRLLLPDMAFCIPRDRLVSSLVRSTGKNLYLKRNDIEFLEDDCRQYIREPVEIRDWPTMEIIPLSAKMLNLFIKLSLNRLSDNWALYLKRLLIHEGVRFITSYDKIYTTRLHVAILSILLGKPFVFFDNSYGKNSSFYLSWLSDLDEIKFIW